MILICLPVPRPSRSTLFPYTTLFRSPLMLGARGRPGMFENRIIPVEAHGLKMMSIGLLVNEREPLVWRGPDRKSTRLNSSHVAISYAVFCLKKKRPRLLTGRQIERPH